jgi:hypothetical protein
VTVHYTCADAGSGIDTCATDQVFSTDGNFTTAGTAVDKAGNSTESGALSVKVDKGLPTITITSPQSGSYLNTAIVTIDWTVNDQESGIRSVAATLDGQVVSKGQVIDLFLRSLGSHTVVVAVTDAAGNTANASVSFSVAASVDSLHGSIDRLLALGAIKNQGIATSLHAKVGKNPNAMNAFLNALDAFRGKQITQQAYDVLRNAALYVMAN